MMDDLLQEMIDPAPVHHDAPRRRRLWTTVAIVGLAAVGATTLTTSAIFTDNDAQSATIESGTVDLEIGDAVPFAFSPQNLAPGDSTFTPLQVQSNGSLQLRYAISYFATPTTNPEDDPVLDPPATPGDLRDILALTVYPVTSENACSAAGVAAVTPINNPGVGEDWPGAATPLVGVPTMGPDTGDRSLPAGASEWLCFQVDFPIAADNAYQDSAVELDLIFNAEQTANN
ncbi:TasA family protein [Cellulomonas sp. Leaf334]|uniref:TasA family protein n=1 Tax=Cellulomonas sp. Leaf334 TaxID=1736339 RepID=UPI0006F1F7A5|nr:TasA family protein [Cellulomonas sp. Leaf334]KQR08224.1 hypothetical protein ASF78_18130 [Cellulomonas sp. Leaf334]